MSRAIRASPVERASLVLARKDVLRPALHLPKGGGLIPGAPWQAHGTETPQIATF